MRLPRGWFGLAVVLCALGSQIRSWPAWATSAPATAPPAAAAPTAPTEPWAKVLAGRAGEEPILLLRMPDGTIVGRTPDGRVSRTLVSGTPAEVLFDDQLELLWLRDAKGLDVVDLRAAVPSKVAIARALPTGVRVTVDTRWGDRHSLYPRTGCQVDAVINLVWSEAPRLEAEGDDPPRRKGRLTGAAWLTANYERAAEEAPALLDLGHKAEKERVSLPAEVGKCQTESDCGKWLPFGQAGWQMVLVGTTSKDACRSYSCLLFEPKTKKFATLVDPRAWKKASEVVPSSCGPVRFDRRGRYYLLDDKVCTAREGCRDLGGQGLGWLRPGVSLGPEA